MTVDAAIEKLLRRDRLIVLGGLAVIVVIAWLYLIALVGQMSEMRMQPAMSDMMSMAQPRSWTAIDALLMLVMWATMMTAMMVPSATPVILLYARLSRGRKSQRQPFAPTAAFLAGYLTVWIIFSATLTALQWGLEHMALLSPLMVSASPTFGGMVLIAAGLYQWSPIKNACLGHCRAPVQFLSTRWRPGVGGVFRMGVEHGLYCLGCCWALMLLLFVGGVMNLLWAAALAVFVLIEKVAPFGRRAGQAGALLLIVSGVFILLSA